MASVPLSNTVVFSPSCSCNASPGVDRTAIRFFASASSGFFAASSLDLGKPVSHGGRLCRLRPRCGLAESLDFNNGTSRVPFLNDRILPDLFVSRTTKELVPKNDTKLRIFSGTSNPLLAQEIGRYLGLELGKIKIKRFADGEIYVQLQESVRGCDVFLVQPTCPPANENLMELLIMIDACRRASAKNITAVIPYFGYARADRKTQGRESLAAKLVANLLTEAGANRVLTCDLHSGQSIGYFDIPVDHVYGQLYMAPVTHSERYRESIDFWRNVYGIDMSAMLPLAKQCAFEEPSVEIISGENVLTWPFVAKHIDCYVVTIEELECVTARYRFSSMMRAPLHGFAFWFDVEFAGPTVLMDNHLQTSHGSDESPSDIYSTGSHQRKKRAKSVETLVLSTAPEDAPTHWQQTLLYLYEPVEVNQDQIIEGSVTLSQSKENPRFLNIHLEYASGGRSFVKESVMR